MNFEVIIKPKAEGDIQYYKTNEQRVIIDGIKVHLPIQPNIESRKKKI